MKTTTAAIAWAFSLSALLGLPHQANAAAAERAYELTTRMVEQPPAVGEFDGSLSLRISPDGIISGFYRPQANPRFVSITGGITGDRVWLDFGTFSTHPLHFSGHFHNGSIDADSDRPFLDEGRITTLTLIARPKSG